MTHNTVSRMNLDHLKTFHYVAKSGSFTQAAHILFLSQPAVSQQIQGLENSLRVSLFDRSRKKITLTSEGKVLYSYTERLFALFDEIEHVFQDLNLLQTGTLTIAATAVMGGYYLPDILKKFNARYPLIHIKIKIGNSQQVMDWVANQEAEIGLAGRVPIVPNVNQVFLHREPYVAVVGTNSPLLQLQRPLTINEFTNSSLVMREKGTRTRAKIEDWLKINSPQSDATAPVITVTNLEATKRLIATGFGITALPYLSVIDDISAGKLIQLQINGFDMNADYYLTYQTNRSLSAAAFQFIMLLREISNEIRLNSDIEQLIHAENI
ncbi:MULTISPECIES: LysR family transcriptional regulator [Providencia]|uniref:LysR family transcriptional regulator n=1 Tax=Providencia TaxID=586 RepID=UPI001C5B00CD|nr:MULTISPECIES: LysR family transcriptional regulator [Providencia]ELR5149983.1 LysR family transcriptional regulator [Providencia rettgeri]QXX81504.1 LysR family transcriptional regulator [Providencia sp. R33]